MRHAMPATKPIFARLERRRSFWRGVGSLTAVQPPTSAHASILEALGNSHSNSDMEAIGEDFFAVGQDLMQAAEQIKKPTNDAEAAEQ